MKKIFTLIGMALMAMSANAQSWVATEEAPAEGASLAKGDLLKVNTVFEAKCGKLMDEDGNATTAEFAGKKFDAYFQVRVDAAPTVDTPTGTQHTNGTPLVIEAKKNVDITFSYRRQYANDAVASNDGKDVKVVDQTAPGAPLKEASFDFFDINGSYAYAVKKYALEEGKTYTFWARGTTIQLYGFDYEAGQGQQGGGETKGLEDGTYFVSYNIDPALSNVTTDEMANTGTANNVATWDNGISVMIMRSDKGMSNGKAITIDGTAYTTIKVSNGAQNKLILPEGNVTKKVTFYSYVNKDAATERDSYWKEVAGVSYGTPDEAGGIFANYGEAEGTPDARTYEFAATNTVTFTNTGEQCCYVIAVEVESAAAGITNTQAANIVNGAIYNLAGQRVANGYRGIAIQNGKKVVIK